jgi:tetratricopeptide (TPR) repeat protein
LFEQRFAKRCLLAGDGGKGKSAVAYRFAQTAAAETAYFKMVVWISAKKRRFEAGRAVDIQNPDFTDLASAINSLLVQYGPVDSNQTLEEKRQLLLECLDDYPTLIVADDIDTVLNDAEVVSLFTFDIPNTASKVLLTSRRDIPGITSINISGFTSAEAELFIHSRISTYQLDPTLFTPDIVRTISEACDGSPLYMDDLMRLTRVVEPYKAAQAWAEKRGDEARKYALKRELDNLSLDAKSVLIAAVVSDQPASFAELHSVLNFSEDRLISSLTELQTLFLLPNASIVEGEQRYHINQNTKRLIISVEEPTDLFSRIRTKSKALAGTLPVVGRDIISQLIRQAILLTSGGKFQKGEELLLNAIERYPNAADLYGFLGYLYKGVNRTTDARIQFERAAKLKSKSEDTYSHWIKMELGEREFNAAVRAATLGIAQLPSSYKLHQLRLDAKYRVAEDYVGRLQSEKAERIWREIVEEIEKILKPRRVLRAGESEISAALFRRLVVCLEHLGDMPELNRRFAQWCNEHKDDPSIARQREIFARRRGGLFKG